MLRALATRGIWNAAAAGVMSGSRPLPDVVTRSTGIRMALSALSLSESSLTRSIRLLLVGPRFDPPEFWALYGAGTVLVASLGSVSVVAEGRPWKYLSPANTWPIRAEPTTLPSRSMRLPFACQGRIAWARPVIARG